MGRKRDRSEPSWRLRQSVARISGWQSVPAETGQSKFGVSAVLQLLRRTLRQSSDDEAFVESEPAAADRDRLARVSELYGQPFRSFVGSPGTESCDLCSGQLPGRPVRSDRRGTVFDDGQRQCSSKADDPVSEYR